MEMLLLDDQDVPNMDAPVSDFNASDKEWKYTLINSLMSNDLCKLPKSIHIPCRDTEDSFCWALSGSGFFITKSATWQAHNISLDS